MSYHILEQQMNLKFCVKLGKNASDTWAVLSRTYWGETMKKSNVFEWHKWFTKSHKNVEGDERSGQVLTELLKIENV
jgi:hypothetical protein